MAFLLVISVGMVVMRFLSTAFVRRFKGISC